MTLNIELTLDSQQKISNFLMSFWNNIVVYTYTYCTSTCISNCWKFVIYTRPVHFEGVYTLYIFTCIWKIWSLYCFRGIIYKKSAILVGLDEISLLSILFLQLSHVSRVQRWTSSTVRTICCYYLMNFNSSCLPQIVSVHLIFCDEKWLECEILTYNCMTCL